MAAIFDDFLVRAVLAGLGVVFAAAPLGCFVVWRKMAYFGDATSHAAVLGVALALAFETSIFGGVLAVSLAMALAVSSLEGRSIAMDTTLGVLAHSALAFGLVAVSFVQGVRVDLMAYLFGDILAVSGRDLFAIWGGALLVVALVWWRWSALITTTLNPDLGYASGLSPRREQLVLSVALAIVVALAIKVVGALLIAAMLLIPPAAARPFAQTPERMAALSVVFGAVAVLGGLASAYYLDTPAGPTIVCVGASLFALSVIGRALTGARS